MHNCKKCGRQLSASMTRCPRCQHSIVITPGYSSYQLIHTDAPTTPPSEESAEGKTPEHQPIQPIHAIRDHAVRQPNAMSLATTALVRPRQPSSHDKTTSALIFAIILVLTLLLIVSGASLLYYAGIVHPEQLKEQAIQTVVAIKAANTHATATVQRQATTTAIAQAKVSVTANAQATIQAKATVTALQDIYAQSTAGQPTLDASFFFENTFNWDIYPTQDGGGCAFNANALHSSVFQANYYAPCIAHATNVRDFALEIQMTIEKGDEGGVIFRSNNHDKNFYSFRLKRDGIYGLILSKNDGQTTPLIYDKSDFIRTGTGQTNLLTVIARNSNIYLYINKHYVGSASDSTYRSGAIGVMAVDRKNGTDIAFNNLRIWKL